MNKYIQSIVWNAIIASEMQNHARVWKNSIWTVSHELNFGIFKKNGLFGALYYLSFDVIHAEKMMAICFQANIKGIFNEHSSLVTMTLLNFSTLTFAVVEALTISHSHPKKCK